MPDGGKSNKWTGTISKDWVNMKKKVKYSKSNAEDNKIEGVRKSRKKKRKLWKVCQLSISIFQSQSQTIKM